MICVLCVMRQPGCRFLVPQVDEDIPCASELPASLGGLGTAGIYASYGTSCISVEFRTSMGHAYQVRLPLLTLESGCLENRRSPPGRRLRLLIDNGAQKQGEGTMGGV